VQMIPTQIFFNAQGKEVKRHIGFLDKQDIVKELRAAGLK
jgi:thioredoxin 1